jgi:hypothetical protein
MIFIDATELFRASVHPHDAQPARFSLAVELLRQPSRGDIKFTTWDAILAVFAFILATRSPANLSLDHAAALIAPIVRLRGFRHSAKRTLLNALDP